MADDKVKVKFLRDEIYETEGRGLGKQFTAGRVYSMTADQAGRWVRRDAAELVEEEAAAEDEGPPKPRRGRPPKTKPDEGASNDDDAEDDEEDGEPLSDRKPPVPIPPVRQPEPPKDPGQRFVAQPTKAPDKVR